MMPRVRPVSKALVAMDGTSCVQSLRAVLLAASLSALVSAGEARAGAPFEKGPYLQALGPNGVTIKVELAAPAPVKVEILAAGGVGGVVASREDAEARAFHAV